MAYYDAPEGIYCTDCKENCEDIYYNKAEELCCRCQLVDLTRRTERNHVSNWNNRRAYNWNFSLAVGGRSRSGRLRRWKRMTLDEYIEVLKKHQKRDVNKCIKFNCSDCEFAISMDKVPTDREILGYFEELKDLRVEHEKNSKELEVYRCALHMAVLLIASVAPPRCSTYRQRFLKAKNIEKNILDSVREELQRKQKAREQK